MATSNKHTGVALSGVVCPDPWVPAWSAALTAIAGAGAGRVSIPFSRAGSSTPLAYVVKAAKAAGLAVDLVPHCDGPAFAAFGYEPLESPETYLSWLAGQLDAVLLGPEDTVTWWNEISPRDNGDWAALQALYTGLGNQIHALIRSRGARSAAPAPMSQTPQDCRDFLDGMMNPQLVRSPDLWNVHLYKDDLSTSVALGQTVNGQFKWIDALTAVTGIPAMLGEYGGTLPASQSPAGSPAPIPDPAFYGAVATYCGTRQMASIAWQWADPGDGLAVSGHPAVMTAIGMRAGVTLTTK